MVDQALPTASPPRGLRLHQLLDVANTQKTNGYPLIWDAATGKWKANQLSTAGLATPPGAHVYHSVAQSIASATLTTLAFDSEQFDTDTIHDNATNNSRLTCKTAGRYLAGVNVLWDSSVATGRRFVQINHNGTTTIARFEKFSTSGQPDQQFVSVLVELTVNDYLEVQVYQNNGSALNVLGNDFVAGFPFTPRFWMTRVG